ncbi:Thioredoxin-like 1-1 [Vigna angularis]|uniref:Thioredoxin-like 1-1 n=1 Tax=Phaseolus angularis TaxID=3914 RepID=A0A8T0KHS9_PHAAN|nr:Thioredoxin-like 1-1 [Vigna angularis]
MARSLKSVFIISELNESMLGSKTKGALNKAKSKGCSVLNNAFMGESAALDEKGLGYCSSKASSSSSVAVHAQATISVSKSLKWWEKNLKPNMTEIHSAQELVHSLLKAGDSLVVVDFYSPGCGGCKALDSKVYVCVFVLVKEFYIPTKILMQLFFFFFFFLVTTFDMVSCDQICQIAGLHPNAIFLRVNYDELKNMCHGLRIHVLPFFRFYKGAEGRVCSFSCTNATIKKFKDAMAKYSNERCYFAPAKGLEESELKILASMGEISNDSSPLVYPKHEKMKNLVNDFSEVWNMASNSRGVMKDSMF